MKEVINLGLNLQKIFHFDYFTSNFCGSIRFNITVKATEQYYAHKHALKIPMKYT